MLLPPEQQAENYINRCQAQNVPIPPDWPWKDNVTNGSYRTLVFNTEFDSLYGVGRGKYFAFSDLNSNGDITGVCVALFRPRGGFAGASGQMGYICQNLENGNACFWDNKHISLIENDQPLKIPGNFLNENEPPEMKLRDMQNGDLLQQNCTDCHRGKNAFLVHPVADEDISARIGLNCANPNTCETPLGSTWYKPVSLQHFWTNPRAEQAYSGCDTCHELPNPTLVKSRFDSTYAGVTTMYCDTILKFAIENTMPSSDSPAGWNDTPDASSTAGHDVLVRQCNAASMN